MMCGLYHFQLFCFDVLKNQRTLERANMKNKKDYKSFDAQGFNHNKLRKMFD